MDYFFDAFFKKSDSDDSAALSYEPLRRTLIYHNLTSKDLCKKAEVSQSTMNLILQERAVSLTILLRICNALDCPLTDVVSYTPSSGVFPTMLVNEQADDAPFEDGGNTNEELIQSILNSRLEESPDLTAAILRTLLLKIDEGQKNVCRKCQSRLYPDALYCHRCGAKVTKSTLSALQNGWPR